MSATTTTSCSCCDDKPQGVQFLGIGNPLLDISIHASMDYLKKYELKAGNAILAEDKHLPIYTEAAADPAVEYCAGGSSMNTTRATQWMLQTPGATTFVGCIGKDDNAKILRKAVEEAGVTPNFLETEEDSTGKCAVLITDKERSMVTYLGAASHYKFSHFRECPAVVAAMKSAKIFYVEGFFVTVTIEPLVELGKRAAQSQGAQKLLFNLSAPFLMEFFWDKMAEVLKYVSVVFCNETEAKAAAKKLGLTGGDCEDVCTIAKALAEFPTADPSIKRIAVITQGADPAVVYADGKATLYPANKLDSSVITDTNGAGDSFVGGFVSQFLKGSDIPTCVKAAHYCSTECLKHVGCRFSGKPDFHK